MADRRICAVTTCDKAPVTRGWCSGHYHRWQRYGDPAGGPQLMDNSGTCSIESCAAPAKSRGLCSNHYYHLRTHGDPLKDAPPRESQPYNWLVEHAHHHDDEACLFWPFARSAGGRPSINISGKTRIAHREMCRLAHGEPPTPDYQAAHSCGRGDDGCLNPNHLRWATAAENEADKLLHGTSNRGERHGMVKLTEDEVRTVRALKGKMSQRAAAKALGYTRGVVCDIWTGRTWGWLK